MRDPPYRLFDQPGQHGFTNPAQAQTGNRDPKLHAIDDLIQILVQSLDYTRADPVSVDQLLDARIAHTDQRKFSSSEESIGGYEQENKKDPQQHEGDH